MPAGELEKAITRSGVLAEMAVDERVEAFDLSIRAAEPSAVYLAVSSEYLIAATLAGQTETGSFSTGPGEVVIQPVGYGEPAKYHFDIDAFVASSSLTIGPSLLQSLEGARAAQQERIFWGLLVPTRANAQSPTLPAVEAERRNYLLHPAVVELRRIAAGDQDALDRATASRFVSALVDRDRDTVRALLSPTLFAKEGRTTSEWLALRNAFADHLLQSGLPDRLREPTIEPSGPNRWRIRSEDGRTFELTTEPFDVMTFVSALEATS